MPASEIFTDRDSAAVLAWTAACQGRSQRDTKLTIPDVLTLIDIAVKKMCVNVFKNGEAYRLMKDFTNVILDTEGKADLDELVIGESVKPEFGGIVRFSGYDYLFDYYQYLEYLYFPQGVAGLAGYCVTGGNNSGAILYCTNSEDGEPLASVTVTVKACQYYTFDTLPEQLKDEFIEALTMMAKAKMEKLDNASGT